MAPRASRLRHPGSPLARPIEVLAALAQQVLLHLAHGIARQISDEDHPLGELIAGKPLFEPPLDGGLIDKLLAGADDHGGHPLAQIGVGDADHRALDDPGQAVDLAFHFLGVDVEAAADDEVLAAAQDMDIAARVDHAEIAGDEEAIGAELGPGLLRIAPIALKDIGTLDLDHPGLAQRNLGAALRVRDAQIHPRQGKPHGARDALPVIGVGGIHIGLGHAVALEDRVARARRPGPVGLGQERGRAGDEEANMAGRLNTQCRLLQQPHIEGRHAHERVRSRQQPHDLGRVEFG